MYHKILILVAALCAVSILLNHFVNGADIDWKCMLVLGIVIVQNLRELQFDRITKQYDTTVATLTSFREATFSVCDDETIDRIELKQADNIVDMAPEDIQPELRKANELLKRLHQFKHGGKQDV